MTKTKTLIMFNKHQTGSCIKWLVEIIGKLSDMDEIAKLTESGYDPIARLSIVLAVMRKCYDAAPDIKSLPIEAAEYKSLLKNNKN